MHDRTLIDKALRAARKADLTTLESLDLKVYKLSDLADEKGASVVHHGARSGNVDILNYLIRKCSFDGTKRSKVGATPAHDAAATGKLNSLIWLLSNTGCSVEDSDSSGATVVHLAAR